jgi:iron complex transport system substrate-binding protein
MRIASLLPSSTEILHELGLGKNLVAVSHDCDYPPDVANKKRLTSIDIDPPSASSKALNEWISVKVHDGTSIYHIEKDALKEANPDLILTQELCEFCAHPSPRSSRLARFWMVIGRSSHLNQRAWNRSWKAY